MRIGLNSKFIFILALSVIFTLSCVSATDADLNSTQYLSSQNYDDITQIIVNESMPDNLTKLSFEIDKSGSEMQLTKDYIYQSGDCSVNISKNFNLNGNGYTIDGGDLPYIFTVDDAKYTIVLKNIVFKNCDSLFNTNHASITIINCDVINKQSTTMVSSTDNYIDSDLYAPEDSNTLTFDDLNKKIYHSDGYLNLTDNYSFATNNEFIKLYKNLILDGNGNYIDAKYSDYVFELNSNSYFNIVLKDIVFENFNKIFNTLENQITIIDCDFSDANDNLANMMIEVLFDEDFIRGYVEEPSNKIIKQAKSIIGHSTGIDAAKKLAKWVKNKIKHEGKAGFYQSAEETLNRKKGNCCSQTMLFLLMCQAIGLDEEFELKFVHVGNLNFKQRHFFALVDNICVDVDGSFSNPWGHGGFSKRSVYIVTKFPLLPLAKEY